jgi:hypothetical protein
MTAASEMQNMYLYFTELSSEHSPVLITLTAHTLNQDMQIGMTSETSSTNIGNMQFHY